MVNEAINAHSTYHSIWHRGIKGYLPKDALPKEPYESNWDIRILKALERAAKGGVDHGLLIARIRRARQERLEQGDNPDLILQPEDVEEAATYLLREAPKPNIPELVWPKDPKAAPSVQSHQSIASTLAVPHPPLSQGSNSHAISSSHRADAQIPASKKSTISLRPEHTARLKNNLKSQLMSHSVPPIAVDSDIAGSSNAVTPSNATGRPNIATSKSTTRLSNATRPSTTAASRNPARSSNTVSSSDTARLSNATGSKPSKSAAQCPSALQEELAPLDEGPSSHHATPESGKVPESGASKDIMQPTKKDGNKTPTNRSSNKAPVTTSSPKHVTTQPARVKGTGADKADQEGREKRKILYYPESGSSDNDSTYKEDPKKRTGTGDSEHGYTPRDARSRRTRINPNELTDHNDPPSSATDKKVYSDRDLRHARRKSLQMLTSNEDTDEDAMQQAPERSKDPIPKHATGAPSRNIAKKNITLKPTKPQASNTRNANPRQSYNEVRATLKADNHPRQLSRPQNSVDRRPSPTPAQPLNPQSTSSLTRFKELKRTQGSRMLDTYKANHNERQLEDDMITIESGISRVHVGSSTGSKRERLANEESDEAREAKKKKVLMKDVKRSELEMLLMKNQLLAEEDRKEAQWFDEQKQIRERRARRRENRALDMDRWLKEKSTQNARSQEETDDDVVVPSRRRK